MTAFTRNFGLRLLPALLAIALAACAAPPNGGNGTDPVGAGAPDWVVTGKLAQYPVGNFINGHGRSNPGHTQQEALELAWANGLAEISNQITADVKSRLESIGKAVMVNDRTDTFEKLVVDTVVETSELLRGSIKADEWYDAENGTGHIFLAMDRIALSERLYGQAKTKKEAADGYRESSRAADRSGEVSNALKSLVRAHRALAVALSNHGKALAVGTTKDQKARFNALGLNDAWNGLIQDCDAMSGTIRLVPVKGNGQTANLTGVLKTPVVVRVTGRDGLPVAGFPVAVSPARPDCATVVATTATTDRDGRFTFTLKELKATGSHDNSVTVALDFMAIEKRNDLDQPRCTVSYLLPTKATTRIAVIIHETIDGRESRIPYTTGVIEEALDGLGFQVLRPTFERPLREVVALSPRALAKEFSGQFDYVIAGTAEAEPGDTTPFVFYFTRMSLIALELESGRTIPFEVPVGQSTKGAHIRKERAIEFSLRNAATVLVGDSEDEKDFGLLGRKFVERFESGAAWE